MSSGGPALRAYPRTPALGPAEPGFAYVLRGAKGALRASRYRNALQGAALRYAAMR